MANGIEISGRQSELCRSATAHPTMARADIEALLHEHTGGVTRWRSGRKLMDVWSAYCEPKTSENIVQLHNFLGEKIN
jgi:hypothetical protein